MSSQSSVPESVEKVAPDQKLADLKKMIQDWKGKNEEFHDEFESLDESGKVNNANETQSTALNVI